MRSPVIRRTTLLGTALFTAAALSLTACGGGGSGGGDSKTVTIWSSLDAAGPGRAAEGPRGQAQGRRQRHHDQLAAGPEHQPADHHQDPGRRHAGHRDDPAARRGRADAAARRHQGAGQRRRHERAQEQHGARAPSRPAPSTASSTACSSAPTSRASIWYPKEAWQKAGYPAQVKDIPASSSS